MIEQLYPVQLIEKRAYFAFILGVAYAIIGIGIAVLLFPEDPALVTVAMISLMFYPTLKKLISIEEFDEATQGNIFSFLKEHKYIFKIYILFFLGALLAFSFFSINLPSLATNHIFGNQIDILYRATGHATFDIGRFSDIFTNNIGVLILIFITAFFIGDGGIFLLTWNASVWGTIFGTFAKNYASSTAGNPLYSFLVVMCIVITHTVLEALAYIFAANSGSVFSKALVNEKIISDRFTNITKATILTLLGSIIILVIAVAVETYVLTNVTFYQEIVRHSFA
jgi:uncharacterized membrane protein SpoIIM required for sporulation